MLLRTRELCFFFINVQLQFIRQMHPSDEHNGQFDIRPQIANVFQLCMLRGYFTASDNLSGGQDTENR